MSVPEVITTETTSDEPTFASQTEIHNEPAGTRNPLASHARSILTISRDIEFLQSFLRVGNGGAEDEKNVDETPGGPLPEGSSPQSSMLLETGRRGKRASICLPPPLKLPADTGANKPSSDTPTSNKQRMTPVQDRRASQAERRMSLSQPQTPAPEKKRNPLFAQIGRDIKLRRIQQQQQELQNLLRQGKKSGKGDNYFRRGEECYTDKDRAAAVNMGTRDIKLSLKMKQRQERSKALQIPDQADPGTLLALGGHEMKGGDLKVALLFINKALELHPNDKLALVSRSKCHLMLGLATEALQDADLALSHDKTFVKAIFQKAEALYHLGDFEHSLMFYHRGLRLRPELAGFRLGVQKAQEAIENTIGSSASRLNNLESPHPVSAPTATGLSAPTTHRSSTSITTPLPPAPGATSTIKPTSASSMRHALGSASSHAPRSASSGRKSAFFTGESASSSGAPVRRHLLGQLSIDKSYLENLLQHPDIKSPHQDAVNHIASHAEEGVAFLKRRQEFWRQQCPNTPAAPKLRLASKPLPALPPRIKV